jgi:hypothetical protein
MQSIGRLSYAWYLWHWPALVFAAVAWGPLSAWQGLGVVALSFVPTAWSHRWIEAPLHHSRIHLRRPREALAGAPAAAGCAIALGVGVSTVVPTTPLLAAKDADGAVRLEHQRTLQRSAKALRPTPRHADEDRSRVYADGCLIPFRSTEVRSCAYGRRASPTTVVLFGDSHAMQHFPALERVALHRNWRLVVLTKAGCPPASMPVYNRPLGRRYVECEHWRGSALARIAALRPALIVASASTAYPTVASGHRVDPRASRSACVAGYASVLRRLRNISDHVVVLRDTPRPPNDPPDCVSEHLKNLRACAFSRRGAFVTPAPSRRAAARVPGVRLIDASSRFCIGRLCPAVIGDVLVYRHAGHITATYSRTMTKWLQRRLPDV